MQRKRPSIEVVRKYGTGGTVVESAEGPPISTSLTRAREGQRLAARGLRRVVKRLRRSEGRSVVPLPQSKSVPAYPTPDTAGSYLIGDRIYGPVERTQELHRRARQLRAALQEIEVTSSDPHIKRLCREAIEDESWR